MAVALKVNEHSLIQNLRFAFSKGTTYLSELLQNARRAGASKIELTIDWQAGQVDVVDDGAGISDLQKVLSIAESGWGPEIMETETPYGMGFLSCLFAASHVTIVSKAQRIAFYTRDALDFSDIPVETLELPEQASWTLVQLNGVKNIPDVEGIKHMVAGFPIPVFLNGVELPRPHSIEGRGFLKTEVGLVSMPMNPYGSCAVYLQGLPVRIGMHDPVWASQRNVVHLDTTRFMGRIPDRDSVVDPDVAKEAVRSVLRQLWVEKMTRIGKQAITKDVAFQRGVLRDKGAEFLGFKELRPLLNQFVVLPPQIIFGAFIIFARDRAAGEMEVSSFTKSDVEFGVEGAVLVDSDLDFSDDDNNDNEMAIKALLRHQKIQLIDTTQLDSEHWVFPHLLSHPEKVQWTASQLSESVRVQMVYFNKLSVSLCDSITVSADFRVGNNQTRNMTAEIDDYPLYQSSVGLLVPAKSNGCDGARQAFTYLDEGDDLDESAMEKDDEVISRHVQALRHPDPAKLLQTILHSDVALNEYAQLAGHRFEVSIQKNGQLDYVHVITG